MYMSPILCTACNPAPFWNKLLHSMGLVSAPDPFHTCAEKGVEYTRGKGLANRVGVAWARVGMWEQLERNDY